MELQGIQWDEIIQPEIAIGLLGVILLVSGARLYRLAIMLPGFFIGWYVAIQLSSDVSPAVQLALTGFLSILGGISMLMLEQLAIALSGALIGGGIVQILVPEVFSIQRLEWYWPFVGAFFGALIFPNIFKKSLVVITSFGGALCIVYSWDLLENTAALMGLSLFGWFTQRWFLKQKKNYVD